MRGRFLHNWILDAPEEHFRSLGATTTREYQTRPGRGAGFIDLFVLLDPHRIAVEAELSADRVVNDVRKASEATDPLP